MTTSLSFSTMFAAATVALAVAASDAVAAVETAAPHPDTAAASESATEGIDSPEPPEPTDWAALDWHPGPDPATGSSRSHWSMPTRTPAPVTRWSRTEHADGSAAVTVKRSLSAPWDSRIGADFNLAPPAAGAPGPVDPANLFPGTAGSSAGAAWASLSAPSFNRGTAALNARLDAAAGLGKASVTASNAMPLGRQLSLTLQSGYAASEAFAPIDAPAPIDTSSNSRIYTAEQVARLTILPTQTKVAAGLTMSTADARWLRTLSAEQTLFEGASVIGSVSESAEGPLNTSVIARFQRHW